MWETMHSHLASAFGETTAFAKALSGEAAPVGGFLIVVAA
jgi:hypothetical protein